MGVVQEVESGRQHGVLRRLGLLVELGERGQCGADLRTAEDHALETAVGVVPAGPAVTLVHAGA